ncbi:probable transcription factor At3g04930 isoform X2 [Telopea speciosissima]|uniref:probable transcription factor At3g04930 isoform X2 n=1 Tax=Telopea speciosissima TaxID=54955 RepID=UPI001CC740FA|nr:probable transcription factor At3g04930 isoform X2 [Telopea speciosissima]
MSFLTDSCFNFRYNIEELEDDDLIIAQPPEDDEEEEDEEEDINSVSPSTSSSSEDNPNKDSSSNVVQQNPTNSTTITTAFASSIPPPATALNGSADEKAAPAAGSSPDHKRQRTSSDVTATPSAVASEGKKPPALDDSRRLFQRLWTDGDEIGLLQGFLDYTMQRGTHNSSHHHDTAPFYDQIKTQLHLDFNKNQLVEKLRRLKKKYRNVLNRISSGKEFSFKSPHDQATFEISRKIWSSTGGTVGVGVEEVVLEDEEGNPNPTSNTTNCNENFHNINNNSNVDANKSEIKMSRSQRRSRKRAAEDHLSNYHNQTTSSIPNVIEDTVRSCLSPLFKELLYCAISSGGPCNAGGYGGGLALNPLPLNFGGNNSLNFSGGEVVDEKWRKQQILELEVYSKRIELVQDQIKSALEKLKSMDG